MTKPTTPIRSAAALGRALRSARENQGLTQSDLAVRGRSTRWAVLNLEAGHETQAMRNVFELVAALGLELTLRSRDSGS